MLGCSMSSANACRVVVEAVFMARIGASLMGTLNNAIFNKRVVAP